MKKGVAVPYIIAILLGIAVIGLVGYWFFVSTGRIGSTATLAECQTMEVKYCSEWSKTDFASDRKPSFLVRWNDDCNSILGTPDGATEPLCRTVVASLKPTGTACTENTECQSGSCKYICLTGETLDKITNKCKKADNTEYDAPKKCAA